MKEMKGNNNWLAIVILVIDNIVEYFNKLIK